MMPSDKRFNTFSLLLFWHIGGEKVIEAAILADDDDDVLDRRGGLDRIDRVIRIGSGLGRCAKAENR